jgi:hypothetical protein
LRILWTIPFLSVRAGENGVDKPDSKLHADSFAPPDTKWTYRRKNQALNDDFTTDLQQIIDRKNFRLKQSRVCRPKTNTSSASEIRIHSNLGKREIIWPGLAKWSDRAPAEIFGRRKVRRKDFSDGCADLLPNKKVC